MSNQGSQTHDTDRIHDPRTQVDHPIDTGQVYTDARTGEELVLVFCNDSVALCRDEDDNHRLAPYDTFEANVGADRYSLAGTESGASSSKCLRTVQEIRDTYADRDGRTAAHKVAALDEAIERIANNGRADDNELVAFASVDGIGAGAAEKLVEHGFRTKGDVRGADRDDILSVPLMGESNTSTLLDHCSPDTDENSDSA